MRTSPRQCPRHGTALDGGPVLYTCHAGHSVYAADLDTDYHPATRRDT